MSSGWDEIKRLAADLQRIQLSSTVQKLSERNCIQLISKLVELHLIELVHTVDGKEFLTQKQLEREIRDELIANGGRVNLVDLQQIINVDLTHIENKAADIIKNDRSIVFTLGQLMTNDYLNNLVEEVVEIVREKGQLQIGDIAREYDLPGNFILEVIMERQVKFMKDVHLDGETLYTDFFVNRHMARIRGALLAATQPISLTALLKQHPVPERMLANLLKNLEKSLQVNGTFSGKQERTVFIPHVYTAAQQDWIDSFVRQNGYIEYSSLNRVGISDGEAYLKKRFKKPQVEFLSACCVSETILGQVEAAIEDAVSNKSWVDVTAHLPTVIGLSDAGQILHICMGSKIAPGCRVSGDVYLVTREFVESCQKQFDVLLDERARVEAPKYALELAGKSTKAPEVESSSKSAGKGKGKRGGKEKGGRKNDDDYDNEEKGYIYFLSENEIVDTLSKNGSDCPKELLQEVAATLKKPLAVAFRDLCLKYFAESQVSKVKEQKGSIKETQEKIVALWNNAKLFERGTALFKDEATKSAIEKHILKTVCNEIINLILQQVGSEHISGGADQVANPSHEQRKKTIAKMPEEDRKLLNPLNDALNEGSWQPFFDQLDDVCRKLMSLMLKKPDKKKERQLVLDQQYALKQQLHEEGHLAMALHLTATVLLAEFTGNLVHAPGKCVPQLVKHLEEHLSEEDYRMLTEAQAAVGQQLKDPENSSNLDATWVPKMRELGENPRRKKTNAEGQA